MTTVTLPTVYLVHAPTQQGRSPQMARVDPVTADPSAAARPLGSAAQSTDSAATRRTTADLEIAILVHVILISGDRVLMVSAARCSQETRHALALNLESVARIMGIVALPQIIAQRQTAIPEPVRALESL